jgi:hypothetical protein
MAVERQVIVSTGVIVTLSGDEEADYSLVSRLGDALMAAAESVAAEVPECQGGGTFTFHYLGDDSVNAERCSSCGQWATDLHKPDTIDCVQFGDSQTERGRFICIPCQTTERERHARHKGRE